MNVVLIDLFYVGSVSLIPCQRVALNVILPFAELEKGARDAGVMSAGKVGHLLIRPGGEILAQVARLEGGQGDVFVLCPAYEEPQALAVEAFRAFFPRGARLEQEIGDCLEPIDGTRSRRRSR